MIMILFGVYDALGKALWDYVQAPINTENRGIRKRHRVKYCAGAKQAHRRARALELLAPMRIAGVRSKHHCLSS